MTTHFLHEGNIVEWWEQPASIATGIIGNVPPVRRIGRISHFRPGRDEVVIYDPDGIRCVRTPDRLTVLVEYAEPGWSRLA